MPRREIAFKFWGSICNARVQSNSACSSLPSLMHAMARFAYLLWKRDDLLTSTRAVRILSLMHSHDSRGLAQREGARVVHVGFLGLASLVALVTLLLLMRRKELALLR